MPLRTWRSLDSSKRSGGASVRSAAQTAALLRIGGEQIWLSYEDGNGFDVTSDGSVFSMIKTISSAETRGPIIDVLVNWFEELKARAPTK